MVMDETQQQITRVTGEIPRAVVTDNNEPNPGGRRSKDDNLLRVKGEDIRQRMTIKLSACDLDRPLQFDMHYNQNGNVYMTS